MKRDPSTCPIRPMDLGDWPAVWDLHADHAAPLEPLWRILRMPADKPHKISGLVAYDGPAVVGYAMFRTIDKRCEALSVVVSEPRSANVVDDVIRRENAAMVRAALRRLRNRRQQLFLLLYYWRGWKMPRIAARAGCSKERVKSVIDEGLAHIRKAIACGGMKQ